MTSTKKASRARSDPAWFIRSNLRAETIEGFDSLRLYTPHPGSGLRHLRENGEPGDANRSPYWAYVWAGGAALAHHILANPETVAGKRVMDAGTGSGIVAIASARAGAVHVIAADRDPYAAAAARLNADLNGVRIEVVQADIADSEPPATDIVLAGDVFYDVEVAGRVIAFLERCLDAGIEVLIGDPFRAGLPRDRLRLIAEYDVPDMGGSRSTTVRSGVFALQIRSPDHRRKAVYQRPLPRNSRSKCFLVRRDVSSI